MVSYGNFERSVIGILRNVYVNLCFGTESDINEVLLYPKKKLSQSLPNLMNIFIEILVSF